jgi:hypothetical protein
MMTAAVSSVDPLDPASLGARAVELLRRDHWSREKLAEYQRDRLRELIRHASSGRRSTAMPSVSAPRTPISPSCRRCPSRC